MKWLLIWRFVKRTYLKAFIQPKADVVAYLLHGLLLTVDQRGEKSHIITLYTHIFGLALYTYQTNWMLPVKYQPATGFKI